MERPSKGGVVKAPAAQPPPRVLQRKCACAACNDCEKKPMQRAATGPAPAVPESVTASMVQSAGQALPLDLRQSMESRFGRKFDSVRVFTDEHAATAARNANARAFTTGESIYFAAGEYQPDSERGRELIAHELTHVAQQHAGRVTATGIGRPDDAFEHEAERAAKAVTRGERPAVGMGGGGEKIRRQVGREVATTPVPDALDLPALKTSPKDRGGLLGIYRGAARTHTLRTTHAGRSRETGTSTDTLWDKWASTRPAGFFGEAGNTPAGVKELIAGRKAKGCQVDHVLELQVGGADDPNNMRLLNGPRNMKAGSQIAGQIRSLYSNVPLMRSIGVPPDETKAIIEFAKVQLDGGPEEDPECLDWELERRGKGGATAGTSETAHTIETKISGKPASIFADDKKAVVKQSMYAVPGFQLEAAEGEEKGAWKIDGVLSPNVKRIPVLKPAPKYAFDVAAPKAKILLSDRKLAAEFPNLSKAVLEMQVENEPFTADGILKPSHPLFKYVDVALHLEKDNLSATAKITPEMLKKALPVPGLDITEASLGLAFVEKEFSAKGGFALKYTTIADGRVDAKFGAKGFEATGDINLHIPGLTEAKGKVWYREAKLGGKIEIGAKQLKVPGVKSAKLVILIQDGMLTGDGTINLGVPGVKEAALAFAFDPKGNFSISGTAALSIPGLKESSVALSYAENDLRGVARAGLAVPGLESAVFEVRYAKGNISGAGDIAFKKGKLAGKVHAELTEKHKLIGKGELAYDVFPGLAVAVGIELLESGTTKVSGEVRVPESITLFALRQYEKTLFSFGVQIPIFAIPLGTRSVGLVAEIGADIKARAGIGPGQLRGVKAAATLDMSKPEASLEFLAKAELYIPAYADLRLAVHGGIGLSLAIASATGGIELAAILGVRGALATPVQIQYKNNLFVVDAAVEILAQPVLKFDISAYVKVDLDLLLTTIEVYRKDWKLASREWGSGLTVGLRFPVHYEAGKPFNLSLDQLQFVKPEIDVMKAVKELLPH